MNINRSFSGVFALKLLAMISLVTVVFIILYPASMKGQTSAPQGPTSLKLRNCDGVDIMVPDDCPIE